jgi:hypothetical protein
MARAQKLDGDIPLIEEQVETGLGALLDTYRSPYSLTGEKKDDLLKRFTLKTSERLPEFDHEFAKGFGAIDDFNTSRNIYAMVFEHKLPYRHQAIQAMLGATAAHTPALLGAGTVYCSHVNEARYVLFMERPQGTRLSELMKSQPRLHEHKVIDFVLQPVIKSLLALREKGISHGNINPGSIYIGDPGMLGESYTMPSGMLSHHLYEPLERLMCEPLGYGQATEKSDVYAVGILAYELLYGLDKVRNIPKDDFIKHALNLTTYQIFATNREFSDSFQDFFRGILNDNPSERWGLDQMASWLAGKRFNMIAPSPPKEAARPFTFSGENFFSRRLLAHALHRNWREASKDIKGMKLERWAEMSLHRVDMAERIERALRNAGEASTERQISDTMTRLIAILDPTGPLRSMNLSLRPDAIGILLANMMRENNQTELSQLLNMIETDVPNFWAEQADANKLGDMGHTLWKLQRVRPYLKNKAYGFGLERVLYELNPSMPCQSEKLREYHITSASEVLKTLDALASQLAPDTSFADRHIAAFVAAKLDMGKEMRLNDLASIPKLAHNEELIVMRILAKAQQKNDKLQLVGLCAWAAMRIEKMIDEIHNRVIRKRMKLQLKRIAQTGMLDDVLNAIINADVAQRDYEGFAKAIALHQINHNKIERFENPQIMEMRAKRMGGKMATMVSYVILTVTTYLVMTDLLGY